MNGNRAADPTCRLSSEDLHETCARLYVFATSLYYDVMRTDGHDIDSLLPFLLQKRNIARIEDDALLIGDRRVFPFERRFVSCHTVDEVVQSIKDMVTQGGGPLQVSLTTIEWLATMMRRGDIPQTFDTFTDACRLLKNSRPTNTTMARTLDGLLDEIHPLFTDAPRQISEDGISDVIITLVRKRETAFDSVYERMGRLGATLIHDGDRILTTCFAEHTFLLSLIFARQEGRTASVYVSETRPYFQGARLTAPSLESLGFEVRLICDGMGAHYIEDGTIDRYMTAADLVCADGTVVNKTGTLANAVCAHAFGIPYHAFSMAPDRSRRGRGDIVMEERDGRENCLAMGHPTTLPDIPGCYPAFDIIPPNFVSSVITAEGIFKPDQIGAHEFSRPGVGQLEETT